MHHCYASTLIKLQTMQNDPTLDGKYLGTISTDFVKICDRIKEMSYLIRQQSFSLYPVFPMAKTEISLGQLLIEKDELENQWHYYAAYWELLVQSQLVDQTRLEDFKKTYKDPDEFCCLLVVDPGFVNFVYMPYPEDA